MFHTASDCRQPGPHHVAFSEPHTAGSTGDFQRSGPTGCVA